MGLNEAISHLEETLADKNHFWACEDCRKEHIQLLEWLKELKDRRESEQKSCLNCFYMDTASNHCDYPFMSRPWCAETGFSPCEKWKPLYQK